MNGLWALISALVSFLITVYTGKKIIPILERLKCRQTILSLGPSWHEHKQGTPTMGGIMFIIGTILSTAISIPLYYFTSSLCNVQATETPFMIIKTYAGLVMAFCYGLLGFFDDYLKVVRKQNKGLGARQKLVLQFLIAISYMYVLYLSSNLVGGTGLTQVSFPFIGRIDFSVFFWPLAVLGVVGLVNAVNLTDGIDGLSCSVMFFVGIFLMIISGISGMFGICIESSALVGGCLGFLIYNFYPARVFMGDTGSLFLGGMLCAIGLGMQEYFILILLSLVYIIEMLSVIVQVTCYKLTGKKPFLMSPIHHHFEMIGLSEVSVCTIFSLFSVFLGIISLLLVIFGI